MIYNVERLGNTRILFFHCLHGKNEKGQGRASIGLDSENRPSRGGSLMNPQVHQEGGTATMDISTSVKHI